MVKRLPLLFWPAVAAAVTASMLSVKPCTNAGMEPSPFRFEEPHGALAAFVLVVAVMLVVRYIRTPQRTGSASGTTFSHMGSSRKELLFHVAWSSCLMVGFPLVWIALRENLPALPQALLRLPAIGLLPVVLVVGALYFFSPGPGMGQAAPFKLGHVWAALPYFVFRAGMPEEFLFRFCILQASFHAWGAWPAMAFNVCLFSGCHVVSQVGCAVRAGAVEHVPWGLVALQVVTVYVPATFILCYVWLSTGSFALCVGLHAYIDAWYLGGDFLQAWQKATAP